MTRKSGRRVVVGAVVAVLLLCGAAAVVAVWATQPDCSRTPQAHPPDAIGVPLERVHAYLADKYDTDLQHVKVVENREDTVELLVQEAHTGKVHGVFRAARKESGSGWLLATTDTCGDRL